MNIHSIKPVHIFSKLKPKKLKFKRADFYVRIRGYGKNKDWADEVIKTADTAVNLIQKDTSCENVIKIIARGVHEANTKVLEAAKRYLTGMLRTKREGWKSIPSEVTTPYNINKYKIYEERLDKTKGLKIKTPQQGLGVSKPFIIEGRKQILHGNSDCINTSLDYIFKLYKNLFPKYLNKNLTPENLADINSTIAEIRWVMAHSTPWMRGSDAISNVFMRAMYKALGIKTYPLKKGISLDLEAYCTSLKKYKTNFTSYFEKSPENIQ